jgi:hypothetical protein
MDKPSHFSLGMNSNQMLDRNYNFSEINNCGAGDEASSSYGFEKDPSAIKTGCQQYHDMGGSSWKSENVEFKQEIEPTTSYVSQINDCSNEFNSATYQYETYNQTEALYPNEASSASGSSSSGLGPDHPRKGLHERRAGPYQISSMKSQLPSWYNPPYAPPHQSSFFQHQYPYHHQGSLVGPPLTPTDHNMRNMIHLTGRY